MHPVSHDSLLLPQACYICQQRIMQLLRREGSSARALLLHALALLSEDGTANSVPRLDVEKYVTNTFPLKQADEALAAAQAKDTMKVQIICAEE